MKTTHYNSAVFIGRFQPFHLGHKNVVKASLEIADRLIIIVGSINQSPDIKNPFSYEERRQMILGSLDPQDISRISIHGVEDRRYNDSRWLAEIQAVVERQQLEFPTTTAIVGYEKDESSWYLNKFPQWDYQEIQPIYDTLIDATEIRRLWLIGNTMYTKGVVTDNVYDFLQRRSLSEFGSRLQNEYRVITAANKQWAAAPYPPHFVTTDAVVIQSGHILMVTRRAAPGAGLLALPGGYLDVKQTLIDSMIRELQEETGIKVPEKVLRAKITGTHVFDSPSRSMRGRIITHAYLIMLEEGPLPKLKVPKGEHGSDEVAKAQWIPLNKIDQRREDLFEDHPDIIAYFTGKN